MLFPSFHYLILFILNTPWTGCQSITGHLSRSLETQLETHTRGKHANFQLKSDSKVRPRCEMTALTTEPTDLFIKHK